MLQPTLVWALQPLWCLSNVQADSTGANAAHTISDAGVELSADKKPNGPCLFQSTD